MTLNITLVSRNLVVQAADFRLTDAATGQPRDFGAYKHQTALRPNWSALVAFTGIGSVGAVDVSQWLGRALVDLGSDATPDDLATVLSGCSSWLADVPEEIRHHTFTVAGYTGTRPFLMVVSNFESVDGEPLKDAGRAIRITRGQPRKPRLFVGGTGGEHVVGDDKALLLEAMRSHEEPGAICRLAADVTERVSESDVGVSPGCAVSWLSADGKGGSEFFGLPEDEPFLPPSSVLLLERLGLQLNPALDEHGKPKPIRMVGASMARMATTEAEHRKILSMNPGDAEAWSNYGAFLADTQGDAEAAERAYRKALALDISSSNAHGNLANIELARGNVREAEEGYKRCLELDPRNQTHRINYARLLASTRGDIQAARSLLQQGLELDSSPDALQVVLDGLEGP